MNTLIIFARAPIRGQVKTRLMADTPLDESQILALYGAFLKDTLLLAARTAAHSIAVHFTPPDAEALMRETAASLGMGARNERRFTYTPQQGETFTARVSAAFRHEARMGGQWLVMIGSDAPLMRPEVIDEAFTFVHGNTGMALGPSGEGGVYLIGLPAGAPMDFTGVFTQGSELENLYQIARSMNMPLRILPETLDVDVGADLVWLIGLARALEYERKFTENACPVYTSKTLAELKLRVGRAADATRGKVVEIGDE
ncbi:MAG: DUF2064 domain-containing protein [Nitrospinae bacterium]|nr:DUF2064 domain-containing protein [Nitrospinota bacterium]